MVGIKKEIDLFIFMTELWLKLKVISLADLIIDHLEILGGFFMRNSYLHKVFTLVDLLSFYVFKH